MICLPVDLLTHATRPVLIAQGNLPQRIIFKVRMARDIEIVEGCWSTPLDPRMPAENRASGDHTNNRAIFYAVRPYAWRDKFPQVSRSGRDLRQQVVEKYRSLLPFPSL